MKRIEVKSSMIKGVGYDATNERLEVEFSNGNVYQYEKVPMKIYSEFIGAKSLGRSFGELIRGKFDHAKVEEPGIPPVPEGTGNIPPGVA